MKEKEIINQQIPKPKEISIPLKIPNYFPLNVNDSSETEKINKKTNENKIKDPFKIDIQNDRFPYCIVWTPIPMLTYIIPFIGHTGICTSNGIIHDFAGSNYVGIDNMAFGNPTKYVQLNPNDKEINEWDNAIEKGDEKFNMENHNLFFNNCHSHCAFVLNYLNYNNYCEYNMFSIWWMLLIKGRYVSFFSFVKTYLGFFIIVILSYLIIKYLN